MNFIQQNGSARAIKDINIRKSQPSTQNPVAGQLSSGQTIQFTGWVTDGESISGNSKWFKTQDENYLWSGNVQITLDTPIPSAAPQAITVAQLCSIAPSVPAAKAIEFADALNKTLQEFSMNTPLRQSAFIAQTAHESIGYTALVENLNYSATALTATWPARFPQEVAASYARQPQKIANRAYANRIGNGDETSGDGWKYRGRGIIQITGKDNYKTCGTVLGLDLVSSPELLEQTVTAFRSGAWFWNSRNLSPLADQGDFTKITKIINGGLNGLDDRLKYYARAKTALGVVA